jgi:hypothetical protein
LVAEDRACPQATAVEKEFLDYCVKEGNKKKVGGRQSDERISQHVATTLYSGGVGFES